MSTYTFHPLHPLFAAEVQGLDLRQPTDATLAAEAEDLAKYPTVEWPVVRVHPGSKRKTLFIGAHTAQIVGQPVPEGRLLLTELLEHATQRQFVYRHVWRPGDLVIWDNRAVLHRGRRYNLAERRELRRSTVEDVLA